MSRLRGVGLSGGMALGTAAVVRVQNGVALLPGVSSMVAEALAARRTPETPQVILVAEEYGAALATVGALEWAEVVGIIAARAPLDALPSTLPAVVNVPDALTAIENELLLLLDAGRGVVFLDPDPILIAQFQAEAENIAPRQRLFLEDEHLPAQTQDGRTITVIADASFDAQIIAAVRGGADIVLTELVAPFMSFDRRPDLDTVLEEAAGKPIWLLYDPAHSARETLEGAARADLTLIVPESDSALQLASLAQLQNALQQAEAECLAGEVVYAMPRLAAQVGLAAEPERQTAHLDNLAAQGVTQLVCLDTASAEVNLGRLAALCAAAATNLLPLACGLSTGEDWEERVALWIGAGASGLVVGADRIETTKERIRELDSEACRAAFVQRWNEEEGV